MKMGLVAGAVAVCVACGAPFAVAGAAPAAAGRHRVVFHVTGEGDERWDPVPGNVENLREAFGPATTVVVLVAHGKGLGMVIVANNKYAERMKRLADGGVAFVACENTMRKKHVTKDHRGLLCGRGRAEAGAGLGVRQVRHLSRIALPRRQSF